MFWRKYKITRREGSLPNLWQDIANFEIFFFCEILIFLFTVYFFGVFFVKRRAPDGRLFYCEVRKQVSDNKTRHTRKIRYSIFEILEHQPTVIVNRPTSSLSLWRHLVIHVTTNATRQKIKSLGWRYTFADALDHFLFNKFVCSSVFESFRTPWMVEKKFGSLTTNMAFVWAKSWILDRIQSLWKSMVLKGRFVEYSSMKRHCFAQFIGKVLFRSKSSR